MNNVSFLPVTKMVRFWKWACAVDFTWNIATKHKFYHWFSMFTGWDSDLDVVGSPDLPAYTIKSTSLFVFYIFKDCWLPINHQMVE